MSILDFIKTSPETQFKLDQKDAERAFKEACEVYDNQKKSIVAIRDTQGFAEILRYFRLKKEACEKFFRNVNKNNDHTIHVQGQYDEICSFLSFLENITRINNK